LIARAIAQRTNASAIMAQLIDTAEQTIDELEQAAFGRQITARTA
jgi:hypothetical protein